MTLKWEINQLINWLKPAVINVLLLFLLCFIKDTQRLSAECHAQEPSYNRTGRHLARDPQRS